MPWRALTTFVVAASICAFGQATSESSTQGASQSTTSPVVAYAYVGTNYVGTNPAPGKIYGFSVQSNGASTMIPGMPISGASASLATTSHFLFGTDQKNIVTYARAANGGVHAVASIDGTAHNDTPSTSYVGALTLDKTGADLYAGEINFQGTDNGSFAQFANSTTTGRLTFLENAGISANYGGTINFSPNNKFAYGIGCYFIGWDVFGFYRTPDGKLTAFDTGSTYPPGHATDFVCPSAIAASAKNYAAVAYSSVGQQGAKTHLMLYHITSSGALTMLTKSDTATSFAGAYSLRFDPTGTYLAVGGVTGLQVFKMNSNETFSPVGGAVRTSANVNNVAWDNYGHVYATTNARLYIFQFSNSGLKEVSNHVISNALSLAVLPTR